MPQETTTSVLRGRGDVAYVAMATLPVLVSDMGAEQLVGREVSGKKKRLIIFLFLLSASGQDLMEIE